jgi:hypothetical protein
MIERMGEIEKADRRLVFDWVMLRALPKPGMILRQGCVSRKR